MPSPRGCAGPLETNQTRTYLRLIRRTGWLWIYTSRTTDGRPFKPKKLSVPFLYPGVPAGLTPFRGLMPLGQGNSSVILLLPLFIMLYQNISLAMDHLWTVFCYYHLKINFWNWDEWFPWTNQCKCTVQNQSTTGKLWKPMQDFLIFEGIGRSNEIWLFQ
jgi:hypothetical protein